MWQENVELLQRGLEEYFATREESQITLLASAKTWIDQPSSLLRTDACGASRQLAWPGRRSPLVGSKFPFGSIKFGLRASETLRCSAGYSRLRDAYFRAAQETTRSTRRPVF
jgi:hypothetical protein